MKVTPTALPEVLLIEPRVFGDARGFFFESYNRRALAEAGLDGEFVQDNHSRSARGVLRGLHYQIEHAQGKLVRVIAGEVFDVAVDMRRGSPTFGRWVGVTLSAAEQTHAVDPARLCARLPGALGVGRVSLQDDRLLVSGVRAHACCGTIPRSASLGRWSARRPWPPRTRPGGRWRRLTSTRDAADDPADGCQRSGRLRTAARARARMAK